MAAHKNLFAKVLKFAKDNCLDYEVSHATSTTSSYITIYVNDTNNDWCGELLCRFSDHQTNNEGFHSFDSFLQGNKFSAIKPQLEKVLELNGKVSPDSPYIQI